MFALIGGTGLYKIPNLEVTGEEEVSTPFGSPSSPILKGKLLGKDILFLARHGTGHSLLPHEVNYAANLFALKKLGATAVLSVSAVGSLREEYKPGDLVAIDQYIDFTKGQRKLSYFGDGIAAHILSAKPVSPILHQAIIDASQKEAFKKREVKTKGTYVCVEGPRLGTQAESNMFRTLGADIVGMTNVPEVFLAKEAQLSYASIGVVTDYDSWQTDTSKHVDVSKIFEVYSESISDVLKLVERICSDFEPGKSEACPSRSAIKHAVLTPRESLSEDTKQWLSVLEK